MLLTFSLLSQLIGGTISKECHLRDYGNGGHVCVCTSAYCDTIPRPEQVQHPHYLTYTSNKAGMRFSKSEGTFIETNEIFDNQVYINSDEKYQEIYGWGGAFTDATGININSLEDKAIEKVLESYFSDDGIEYSLCRVPIGGTDFSPRAYSYDDGQEDSDLKNFKLADEDFKYKIPLIKKALDLSKGALKLFASAWTAPKWMKTNNQYSGFGFLRSNMYQAWANYFVKFLEKYQIEGLQFWGLTTGNEPSLGIIPFTKINSVGWTPNSMGTWIGQNLGPTIRKSNFSDIKIMVLDDQRFLLPWFVNMALENKTVRNYVDGIAVHWYYDGIFPTTFLKNTHDNFPEKFLLASEACYGMYNYFCKILNNTIQKGDKPGQKHVDLGSWERGEGYADDIIGDMLNWISGWVDWNMVLNLEGGPTYINNFVDSPIIINSTSGEFYKQPMFYALGHFSKFAPKGSIRIGSSGFDEEVVPVVAFKRPDNGTVVVILNKKEEVVPIVLVDDKRGSVRLKLSMRSVTTMLYW